MKALLSLLFLVSAGEAGAQTLLHQPTNASEPVPISADLLGRLEDPAFNILISANPQPTTLQGIIDVLLAGGRSRFESFVVGEQIGRPETQTECGLSMRRLVVSFDGTHAETGTVLTSNIFLSLFLSPTGTADSIELLAWDQTHGTYNYYKLEGGSWRLRNLSSDLRAASGEELADGCLACHVNGAPVMKEFTFPWNNWDGLSTTFQADYLRPGRTAWPVAQSPVLGVNFGGAQTLEAIVESSIRRFVDARIDADTQEAETGSVSVTGLPGLLDSLFATTEVNLGSSNTKSGLDGGGLAQAPSGRLNIPDSFFLNIMQLSDIDLPVFRDLPGVHAVFTPGDIGLSVDEYEQLLIDNDVDTACMPGRDTLFAWFGPEPSEFDRRMVDRLNRRGVVDDEFVSAVLAIDLEQPLFSEERASLLEHIPESISAPSRDDLASVLRDEVIASLETEVERTVVEQRFLDRLRGGNAVERLDRDVRDYIDRTQSALRDPERRGPELQLLFERLTANREVFRQSLVSEALVEAPGLLPRAQGSAPSIDPAPRN
jgi:hypothetical protein